MESIHGLDSTVAVDDTPTQDQPLTPQEKLTNLTQEVLDLQHRLESEDPQPPTILDHVQQELQHLSLNL